MIDDRGNILSLGWYQRCIPFLYFNPTCTTDMLYCQGRDAMEVASEIVTTITEPSLMVGPEVREGAYSAQLLSLLYHAWT